MKKAIWAALLICLLPTQLLIGQVASQNLAQLIQASEDILTGKVLQIQDGFVSVAQGQLPYTEITLQVYETLKGKAAGTFSFRQFGLIKPRRLANGKQYLGVTPPEWPRFTPGEEVLLFLYKGSAVSGLRSTAGLVQGKFLLQQGRALNGAGNAWLFEGLDGYPMQLSAAEQKMMLQGGAVPQGVFLGLLRKAVSQSWFSSSH
ncbi:MAG: hypothetical protein AAFR61_20400 [Bacteroidota bacterium]